MKKLSLFIALFFIFSSNAIAQEEAPLTVDRDWLIETEPSAFVLNGFHLMVGKNITSDNKTSLSLFVTATDVGIGLKEGVFQNTDSEDKLRLGFQASLNLRYKVEIWKEIESNPYVGLIAGWEYFTLTNPAKEDLRTDVYLITPYVGHTVYFYKQMLYINPQLRGVLYVNPTYDKPNRVETMNSTFVLPQVSLGVRF